MSYVYVVSAPNGLVKIGRCELPFERFTTLQNGSPLILTLEYVCKCDVARAIEAAVHKALAQSHSHREWFEVDTTLAVTTIRDAIKAAGYELATTERIEQRNGAPIKHRPKLIEAATATMMNGARPDRHAPTALQPQQLARSALRCSFT